MVSQNNHRMKQQRLLATNQVFSLRKLSIGFVSVVLGLFFACGTDAVGHAATTQPASSNAAAQISTPTKNSPVTQSNGQPKVGQSLTGTKSNGQPVVQAAVADQKTAEEGQTSQAAPVQNVQIQMATTDKKDPHKLQYSQLYGNEPLVVTVSGEISPTAKAGDTFSINFSDNIRRSDTDEASANNGKQSANPIKDSNGNQIAYGYVDANEDKITYVLLPIVENESNIKFSTSNYFYPQIMKIPNSGTVDAVITVGDQTKHFPLNIQYDNLQQNDAQYGFSARIYDIDFSNGKYKVNAYFNAQNKPLDNQRIEIWARGDNNTDLNPKNCTFRVYRVKDGKTLNASLIPNYSEYDDITNQLKISTNEADAETPGVLYYDAATNTVKINFGGKQDSNAYILHFEGQSPVKNGKVHPGMNMHILASRMTLNFSFGSLPAKASASGETADQLAIVRFKGDASVAKNIQLPKSNINEGGC